MKRLIIISLTLLAANSFAQTREPVSDKLVGTPNPEVVREAQNPQTVGVANTETRTQTETRAQAWIASLPKQVETAPVAEPDRSEMQSIKPYVNKYNETFEHIGTQSLYPAKDWHFENNRPANTQIEVKQEEAKVQPATVHQSKQTVSDVELNKQNPDRSKHYVKPSTGQNPGISDAELQKQAPKPTQQPVNTLNNKQASKGDIIKPIK